MWGGRHSAFRVLPCHAGQQFSVATTDRADGRRATWRLHDGKALSASLHILLTRFRWRLRWAVAAASLRSACFAGTTTFLLFGCNPMQLAVCNPLPGPQEVLFSPSIFEPP